MEEFQLVNRALKALGVDVEEDLQEENFEAQDVEKRNIDRMGPSQGDKVSSVITDGKAVHMGANVKLSNASD